jgi:hypothetical protein
MKNKTKMQTFSKKNGPKYSKWEIPKISEKNSKISVTVKAN